MHLYVRTYPSPQALSQPDTANCNSWISPRNEATILNCETYVYNNMVVTLEGSSNLINTATYFGSQTWHSMHLCTSRHLNV